ncbi:MAG: aquaporin [Gaiellaceae bacterium]|jgi:aquaporin Z|nr:aquaporin [Gaiellaceae bacterium]
MRALDLKPGGFRFAHASRVATSDSALRIAADVEEQDPLRRGVAEFVGAFTLIFIGGGAGIVSGQDIVAVALANGLAIGIMVSNLGHISGAHFNPAITLSFLATRRITTRLAVVYWIAQFGGALVAAAILRGLFTRSLFVGSVPHAGGFGAGKGLVVEIILTFFLVWAVYATAVDPRGAFKSIAGLAIGLTITIDVLMGGPLTGAAMNPARAFGPELLGNFWGEGWIYYLGPVIGALIAACAYDYLYLRPLRPSVVGTPESGVAEPRPGDTALD